MDLPERIAANLKPLRRFARKLSRGNAAYADDLVQATVARCLEKAHLYEERGSLVSWMCNVMHNCHVNQARRWSREGRLFEATEELVNGLAVEFPQLTVSPPQDRGLVVRDLERALDQLPEEQRQVLLLIGMDGMRYDEVARVLKVPVGTIRSRLSRGRDRLWQLLADSAPARRHSVGPAPAAEIAAVMDAGGSDMAIARRYGVCESTARNWRIGYGIETARPRPRKAAA